MPTIIDSLVVMLGLDAKDLEAKTPKAVQALDSIEKHGAKTEKTVTGLSKSFTTLLSVIGGTVALKAFVQDFIETNAQLDRLSKNLNVSVSTISAWSQATERLGGSAQGLQGTMTMLSREQSNFILKGESGLIPFFSMLNIALVQADRQGRLTGRSFEDIANDLNQAFNSGKMGNRTMANNMLAMMGIDQGSANLILQSRKEFELLTKRQREMTAVTKEQAEVAQRLQTRIVGLKQSFGALGRQLLMEALPTLEKMLGYLEKFVTWCQQNKEFIADFFKVIAGGLVAIALLTAPINLTIIAVLGLAAAIALLWQDYQTWKRGGDSLIDWGKWEPGITKAQEAITGLIDLFQRLEWHMKLYAELAQHIGAAFGVKNYGGIVIPSIDSAELSKAKDIAKQLYEDKYQGQMGDPFSLNIKPKALSGGGQTLERMQQYFENRGWSSDQAKGIAANLWAESKGNPNAIGDNGTAFGIAQWHPARQAKFKAWSGKDIRDSSFGEQMAFVQYELTKGDYKAAGDLLRQQTSPYSSASAVSRAYEQPKDVMGEANRRGTFAQSLAGIQGASTFAAGSGTGAMMTPQSVDKSTQLQIDQLTIQTQATDARGIANDFASSLDYLLASQANYGLVP